MLISPVAPTNCIHRLSNPGKPNSHDLLRDCNNEMKLLFAFAKTQRASRLQLYGSLSPSR